MTAVVSPSRGYFIGCEPAGFGGAEGDAQFSWDSGQALDLPGGADSHMPYILREAPDAVIVEGSREEIEQQAAILAAHAS